MTDERDRKRRAAFEDFVSYIVRIGMEPAAARAHTELFPPEAPDETDDDAPEIGETRR